MYKKKSFAKAKRKDGMQATHRGRARDGEEMNVYRRRGTALL